MGLSQIRGISRSHPIQKLQYKTTIEHLNFGSIEMKIESLPNVEEAIDQVFEWLDSMGLPNSEIEHLSPYFGKIWPSAVVLAEWIAMEGGGGRLQGKSLLELGCGLGIPGLVAAKLGAHVTLSDGHPDVLRFLEKNVSINKIENVGFVWADWAETSVVNERFDFIIASDVLYESYHAKFFADMFNKHAHKKTVIVLTDPGRAYVQRFVNEMNTLGWIELLEPWTLPTPGVQIDIFLLRFERELKGLVQSEV